MPLSDTDIDLGNFDLQYDPSIPIKVTIVSQIPYPMLGNANLQLQPCADPRFLRIVNPEEVYGGIYDDPNLPFTPESFGPVVVPGPFPLPRLNVSSAENPFSPLSNSLEVFHHVKFCARRESSVLGTLLDNAEVAHGL